MQAERKGDQETIVLEQDHELRFEVLEEESIEIEVLEGTAEMFGTELRLSQRYTFTNCKMAIFTWKGAKLLVIGTCKVRYVEGDTPMVSYINAHGALDNLRWQSKRANALGPKALVVGPTDSGKSTLCRILLNYAVRASWKPTFVDLDVGQNCISIPGCVAATPITTVFSPNSGELEAERQISYFFGHTSPAKATQLYKKLVDKLAHVVDERCQKNDDAKHSGVIINTCGWVEEGGYDLLVHIANAMEVDVILVLNSRLYSRIKDDPNVKATVAKLSQSAGVVTRNAQTRRKARMRAIKAYFYGPKNNLCPHPQTFKFSQLGIYRCGDASQAPDSALPLGTKRLIDPNRLVLCDPNSEDFSHHILGVSYSDDENRLLDENMAGFVHVSKVDVKKREFTLLTPSAQALPQPYLLTGSLKYFD